MTLLMLLLLLNSFQLAATGDNLACNTYNAKRLSAGLISVDSGHYYWTMVTALLLLGIVLIALLVIQQKPLHSVHDTPWVKPGSSFVCRDVHPHLRQLHCTHCQVIVTSVAGFET